MHWRVLHLGDSLRVPFRMWANLPDVRPHNPHGPLQRTNIPRLCGKMRQSDAQPPRSRKDPTPTCSIHGRSARNASLLWRRNWPRALPSAQPSTITTAVFPSKTSPISVRRGCRAGRSRRVRRLGRDSARDGHDHGDAGPRRRQHRAQPDHAHADHGQCSRERRLACAALRADLSGGGRPRRADQRLCHRAGTGQPQPRRQTQDHGRAPQCQRPRTRPHGGSTGARTSPA